VECTEWHRRNVLDFSRSAFRPHPVEPGMEKINRSRRKKNKPPLTDYHIVRWSETSHAAKHLTALESSIVSVTTFGALATFTRGMLAGQRIWRRPHSEVRLMLPSA
jgi:hypothetical protein